MKNVKLKANGRIWIESEAGPVLGYGRIELLEKIMEYGSISKAAAEMKMSYSQAWELIESMNANVNTPLVLKQTGGKGGGGALITPTGEKMIKTFKELNMKFQHFLEEQWKLFNN